jgi:hypothetical protein
LIDHPFPLEKCGGELDVGHTSECLGNGACSFGSRSQFLKLSIVDATDLGLASQVNLSDLGTVTKRDLVKIDTKKFGN